MASCAPSIKRIGYDLNDEKAGQEIPQIVYEANNLDSTKKIGTLIVYDNGFCIGNSRQDAIEIVIREGEAVGARAANMYNMKEPSFFASSCFQIYADFYSDSIYEYSELTRKYDQVFFIDSTFNSGLSFNFNMRMGVVGGGNQKKPGLVPRPEIINKVGMGLQATYMRSEALGFEAGCDVLYTNANTKGYESFYLFNERVISSGIKYALYRNYSPFMLAHLDIIGGLNYDLLKLSPDMITLLETASGGLFQPYPGYAKGWGWYGGVDFQMNTKSNYFMILGLKYEQVNPKYEQASTAIDAKTTFFQFSFGYNFR
jgi:hypothetical protein